MSTLPSIATLLLVVASVVVHADDDACRKILDASVNTASSARKQLSGYDFSKDTPALYAFGRHGCAWLHDEWMDGEPTAVYREQYTGSAGSTTATIWISRTSGRLLREEQDGDITGKGKGHISYHWSSTP